MKMKICTSCGKEKPATLVFFHTYKRSPDVVRSVCKVCRSDQSRMNRKKNPEVVLEQDRRRREANPEKVKENNRKWRAANVERERERGRKRRADNSEQLRRNSQKWKAGHVEKERERGRMNSKKRHELLYGVDAFFTLGHRVRSAVTKSLRKGTKSQRTFEALGYTIEELRQHIECKFSEGMDWIKFLKGEIHLDHIRPMASFKFTSMDDPDFRECWGLHNLQPLWAFDNWSKGDKWDGR